MWNSSILHGSLPASPPPSSSLRPSRHRLYLDGVLLKDAQLQEDVQLDLPLMEELLHLHLRVVQLLQDWLNVADGAAVGGLVVGHGRVPVADGERREGPCMLEVIEEQGAFLFWTRWMGISWVTQVTAIYQTPAVSQAPSA